MYLLLLRHATLSFVVWHLFADSWRTATATFVSAIVLPRIDYCNSLLFGSTHDVASLIIIRIMVIFGSISPESI